MKQKPKTCYFITVSSDSADSLYRAATKGASLEEAKGLARKLWSLAAKPYQMNIRNGNNELEFFYKG